MPKPAQILLDALRAAASPPDFRPVILGLRDAIRAAGIQVDRVQLPMARNAGFRHPTIGLVIATWSDDQSIELATQTHAFLDQLAVPGVVGTPFEGIILRREPHLTLDLQDDDVEAYRTLRALRDRGFHGYCAIGLALPAADWPQPLSICSRAPYPPDIAARLEALAPVLGLAIYAAQRTSQAVRLAEAYIGPSAGPRVLAGDIKRGSTRAVEAGIMFCDIRGFTPLSASLGAEGVVAVVNQVFEGVGQAAESRGGEILKFIGDALLIVFPIDHDRQDVARAMVATVRAALAAVRALDCGVGVGFGCHIGQVQQGNIGTPRRLDFTVMGPAVNLASRLEGLTRTLGVDAVFSEAVAACSCGLRPAGTHRVKGVAEPVAVWTLGV